MSSFIDYIDNKERYVLIDQLKLFQQHLPSMLVLNAAIALVITIILLLVLPPQMPLSWAATLLALCGYRYYNMKLDKWKVLSSDNIDGYRRVQFIFTASFGFMWGSLGILLPIESNTVVLVLTVVLLFGMTAGSLASLTIYRPYFFIYAVMVICPFIVRCFLSDMEALNMVAIIGIMFLIINLFHSKVAQQSILRAIDLGFENQVLVQRLKEENDRSETARRQADISNQAKSRFLATASHDLRQPLHAMGFFVEALTSRSVSPDIKDLVDKIDMTTTSLRELLNSLLDFSKIESGVMVPQISHINIRQLLTEVEREFKPVADEKKIHLNISTDSLYVKSDTHMLDRIIRNLVSNAIRYTNEGSVTVHCKENDIGLEVRVSDTGPGIPAEERQEIFQEFYQLDNPERDRAKGLGLGLSIVDGLCRQLGIELHLETQPEKGSTFWFILPYGDATKISHEKSDEQLWTDNPETKRILIIDDEPQSLQSMEELVSHWGHDVEAFEDYFAVNGILENKEFIPEVIITDYRLKDNKTGVDAIEYIFEKMDQKVPAMIITGDTDPVRIKEAQSSGYMLLHKPLQPAKLRNAIAFLTKDKS